MRNISVYKMALLQRILIALGNLLFITHCVLSRSDPYGRRAQNDCYIPRGEQYERSIYRRAYGIDLKPLSPGFRISNGKRITTVCQKDIQGDAMLKSTVSRCIFGKWKPSLPSCIELKRCGNAPVVPLAIASEIPASGKTYPHGYVVRYECWTDYFQAGSNEIKCQNGQWTEPSFVCEEPIQPDLCREMLVMNADITEVSVTQYKVTCHYGYELEEEQEIYECNAGNWVTKTPVCTPVSCPNVNIFYDVLYGGKGSTGLTHDTQIRIQCPVGQKPFRGINNYRCKNGRWKPFKPHCRRYCNIRKKFRSYSRFTDVRTYQNVNRNVQHGHIIRQRCLGETRSRILRCWNGRWRPGPKECPPVNLDVYGENSNIYRVDQDVSKGCSLIPGNGFEFQSLDESIFYDHDDVIPHDATIQQVCKEGRKYRKRHVVHCNNGTWYPGLKACPNSDCNLAFRSQDVQNGTIKVSDGDTDLKNSICSYKFELEDFKNVVVTFVTFNVSGDSPECSTSYLSYKSESVDEEKVRLCGETLPASFKMFGPDAVMSLNTLRAKVATFEANFEIIAEVRKCPTPDHSNIVYTPIQETYYVNDTIQAVGCRDEFSYLVGPNSLVCQENATWSSSYECIEPSGCTLKEQPGVIYQVGNSFVDSGDIDHGTNVVVTVQCGGAPTYLDNLNSYQTLFCENGTLSGEVFGCPEENLGNEGEGKKCSSPKAYGVKLLPEKATYDFYEKVKITGCDDVSLIPIGSKELMCRDNGEWFGSVKCQRYCENGISNIRETEFNFFRRKSNVQYHQITDVSDLVACHTECESFKEFTCLSFEYRTDKSVCTLVNGRPNGEHFVQLGNTDVIKVYERACDDRCRVPDPMPKDLSFLDEAWGQLVPRQVVPSGTTIKAVCKKSLKADLVTCMGGKWNKVFNDDFCQQS